MRSQSSLRNAGMVHEEFNALRNFVYEKSGIYFLDNKAYLLETRLRRRLQELNLSTFDEYYHYLRYAPRAEEELFNLFDAVTTKETSFFRNETQVEILRSLLKSNRLNRRSQTETVRIWSAGCSTGEEPYTIAIAMLEERALSGESLPFVVIGTDISKEALRSAQTAVFTGYAMRNVAAPLKEKYFAGQASRYFLSDSVKRCVKFKFLNLLDVESCHKLGRMDIVYCRNVLIYFGEDMKKRVATLFYDMLKPGGYLFLGYSEYLHPVSKTLKPIIMPGTIVYQKAQE